jgi:hypothetical protein
VPPCNRKHLAVAFCLAGLLADGLLHEARSRDTRTLPDTDPPGISSDVADLVLEQLSARHAFSDYELVIRMEIEMLCLANPDERDFLLAYFRYQIRPPSFTKARLR